MLPSVKWPLVRFGALLSLLCALCLPIHLVHQVQAHGSQSSLKSFNCDRVSEIPKSECQALVAIYNKTNGGHWVHQDNWLTTSNPCSWWGVGCDDELHYVTKLDFSNNRLVGDLPVEFGSLPNLRVLSLSNNQLTSLPAGLGNMVGLQWVELDSNQLTSLPVEIGKLNGLHTLLLSHNHFVGLPAELGNLSNLFYLDLDNNFLKSVPGTLGNLSRLETLSLDNNQLSSLPPEFGNLVNLESLSLDSNQLTTLPSEMGNLKRLYSLSANNNQLVTLPLALAKINIRKLSLNNNKLTDFPTEWNNFFLYLDKLQLAHNQLTRFPFIPFYNFSADLEELILNDNQLTSFPVGELGTARLLYKLDLHNNPNLSGSVKQLFWDPPLFFPSLQYFDFRNTRLCESADPAFQKWLTERPTLLRNNKSCLTLNVNFSTGAPGSQFTLTGNDFPTENVVTLSVNGVTLGTVQPDVKRQFTVTLSSTVATTGTYVVTADMGLHTLTTVRIAADAPLHTPVGDSTFDLPAGIAYPHEEYLPLITQN